MTTIQSFHADFPDYIQDNTLVRIKGGRERDSFLNTWMIEVDGRYFLCPKELPDQNTPITQWKFLFN
jgi:hypothetical protein